MNTLGVLLAYATHGVIYEGSNAWNTSCDSPCMQPEIGIAGVVSVDFNRLILCVLNFLKQRSNTNVVSLWIAFWKRLSSSVALCDFWKTYVVYYSGGLLIAPFCLNTSVCFEIVLIKPWMESDSFFWRSISWISSLMSIFWSGLTFSPISSFGT